VVLDGTRPVGLFTHSEALALRKMPAALRRRPVEEAMSYETVCLDETTPLHRAAGYMAAMRVRRLLVVRSQRLVGVVSALDMVGVLAQSAR
jgi:CBS domain-containing protein